MANQGRAHDRAGQKRPSGTQHHGLEQLLGPAHALVAGQLVVTNAKPANIDFIATNLGLDLTATRFDATSNALRLRLTLLIRADTSFGAASIRH